MALRVKCKCGKALKVSSKLADRKMACPHCKRPFRIPAAKFRTIEERTVARPSQSDILTPLDDDAATLSVERPVPLSGTLPVTPAGSEPVGPVCPSCHKALPAKSKICVQCGINIKTGRSLLTAEDGHLDAAYILAERVIEWLSWVAWWGLYPVASEAFGTRKPWVVRSVAVLTVITSCLFWAYDWSGPNKMQRAKNLMLWSGEASPDADHLASFYASTNYGDSDAFFNKLKELNDEADAVAAAAFSAAMDEARALGEPDPEPETQVTYVNEGLDEELFQRLVQLEKSDAEMILEAHHSLPKARQCLGQYHDYQLLTNAFLHGDFWHLTGNLLFLMIFGGRVNALIGNIATLVLYPVLAVGASLIYTISAASGPPIPALGASGAIMGLAGMYFVIFPAHNVHMAVWARWIFVLQPLYLTKKIFTVRGFWVVLFYIAFDVVYTILGVETGTAHWAHLGGFLIGVGLALVLLFTRLINGRGGDILSATLGRHAWVLIGKPRA